MFLGWIFPDFARRQREQGAQAPAAAAAAQANVPANANNNGDGGGFFGDPLLNFQAPAPQQAQPQPPAGRERGVGRAGGDAFADLPPAADDNQQLPNAAAEQANAGAQNEQAVPGAAGAVAAAAAVEDLDRPLMQILADYSYTGAPVPAREGILLDIYSLASSAILSLVPEWSPYGR
jgi:hypothetical protein